MHTRLHSITGTVLIATLFAACGGGGGRGGDGPPAAPTGVPDSALVSPASYTAFARSLGPDDSGDPLNLERVEAAPVSEIDEPTSLD